MRVMDILEKYNQENPPVPVSQTSQWESSEEYSFLVCMVMKWSGGKIQNERQANYVLIGIAVVMMIATFIILGVGFSGTTSVVPLSST